MTIKKQDSEQVAQILLKINAVKLQPNNLFTWSSGKKSPIYCDNRLLLSHVDEREQIINLFCLYINKYFPNIDYIAGVATGAIAHGMMVASKLKLPFIYVREKAKNHGRQNQIEGALKKGSNVIVIEDLISTGKSSINAIRSIQEYGANVNGLLSIFSYEICEEGVFPVEYIALCNYNTLIQYAKKTKIISKKDLEILYEWHQANLRQ